MKKRFKIPIYHGTLTVIITDCIKDALDKERINYEGDGSHFHNCFGVACGNENNYYVIFHNDAESLVPRVIAHEAKHLVNLVFTTVGVKLDRDNDEAECYFLGWVVEQIHNVVDKYQLKKMSDES